MINKDEIRNLIIHEIDCILDLKRKGKHEEKNKTYVGKWKNLQINLDSKGLHIKKDNGHLESQVYHVLYK